MKQTIFKLCACAGILAAALGISGCRDGEAKTSQASGGALAGLDQRLTGSPQDKTALRQLYEDTLKSGESETVIYISSVAEEVQPLADAFARAFPGVRANFQRLMGDKLRARLDGEFNSGKRAGDIVIGGSIAQTLDSMPRDRWESFRPPTAGALEPRFRDADGYYTVAFQKGFTIAYNPSLIAAKDVPRDIRQVLDPRWKGRYGHLNFGATLAGDSALLKLYRDGQLNDAGLAEFAGGGGAAVPPSSELVPWVAQGRLAFTVWINAAAVIPQQQKGANVALSFSPRLDLLIDTGIGILKRPPNPHAARLLTAWIFTPEAQKILGELNFYGAMPDAPKARDLPPRDQYLNKDFAEDQKVLNELKEFRRGPLAAILKKS